MTNYLRYWLDMIRWAVTGSWRYYCWILFLVALIVPGVVAYWNQLTHGLIITNMSDQVSWGAYIANFTFLVGVAAAAVILVVPSYVYGRKDTKDIVLLGEILAFCAMVMCLMFIAVDLGRPDRFLHILPFIGRLNLPQSILAWDVLALTGYLLLNMHIPGYVLYKRYRNEEPRPALYRPFVYISILWAVSIHTITAFLYSGLGGRPFWNSAILAPRFLVSAFAVGPALMLLAFKFIDWRTNLKIDKAAFDYLKRVVSFTLPLNLFLFFCEVFTEFYTNSTHVEAMRYLFFGLHGHAMIAPYIWASLVLNIAAMTVFVIPALRARWELVIPASMMCVGGIWIEKGMGLVIPGFVPTPLGDVVEYMPSPTEFFVSLGIWAFGALMFTVVAKVAITIETGSHRTA